MFSCVTGHMAAELRRSLLLKSTLGMFGVDAALHKEGIPSLAFIALDGRRGHLDKLDPARMRRETIPAHRLRPDR